MNFSPWDCFRATFRQCCTNLACAPFFLLAIVFYSLYYCWPYMAQLPDHLKVVVADEDQSPLSRRLIMELRATPRLNVTIVTDNREDAVAAMRSGAVASLVGIPADYEKDVLNNVPTAISLVGNGAFIVKYRSTVSGVTGPLEAAAAAAVSSHLAQYGIPLADLELAGRQPPPVVVQYMFNTLAGYLNFVVPIVFIIILQTLMICGTGMLLNYWFNAPETPAILRAVCADFPCLAGAQLAIACLCFFWTIFVEGAAFALHGVNSFQNVGATLATALCFALAVSALGALVGLLFQKSNYVIQAVVTSSIPCVFITGNLFPVQNIPVYMQALSWLFPSTPAADAMLRASQAGATLGEAFPHLLHLLALAAIYLAGAYFVGRRIRF